MHFILGAFFQIKPLQAPFCPNFPQLARKILKKHELQRGHKGAQPFFQMYQQLQSVMNQYLTIY